MLLALLEIAFWAAAGLIVYTHVGYPLALALLVRLRRHASAPVPDAVASEALPRVSLIVAAHDEEDVIARWLEAARELDYPRERLEVIVADDGSSDATAARAREAGADLVLELERGGKVTALNAAVERSSGDVLAFSDANAAWAPQTLRRLVAALAEPGVGYVCGRLRLTGDGSENQEGLYWRYEMAVRALESRLAGVTAGNGAVNAIRRDAYIFLAPTRGQDISLPFELSKRGWRAIYEPAAEATEPMAPTLEGEFRRKRRMMAGAWGTLLETGMLSPRGYRPLYAFEIVSHRLLRYASPILHLVALGTNLALLGQGPVYTVTLALQVALLLAAAAAGAVPLRPLRIARYYVVVTFSSAVGLWDYLRHGTPRLWEPVEGTR
jgi:cellulose synthase/poly-beta-1,6-N-acetylglucosamine synthase-like glycosyltransferase